MAGEQTMQVNPARENKKAPGSSPQRPAQATRPAIPSSSPANQPIAQAQSHTATATAARTSSTAHTQNSNNGSSGKTGQKQDSGNSKQNLSLSSLNMKVVIALVVIVVLLIVAILIVAFAGHNHSLAPHQTQQGLIFYYYQRFSPNVAS
jgi:cobalamin biosynthesis Mg chelatase CobN